MRGQAPCFGCDQLVAPCGGLDPADLGEMSAAQWVFERNNVPMRRTEWWYHGATQLWFKVLRDTATDTIIDVTTARD